jgi:hypothetical protein
LNRKLSLFKGAGEEEGGTGARASTLSNFRNFFKKGNEATGLSYYKVALQFLEISLSLFLKWLEIPKHPLMEQIRATLHKVIQFYEKIILFIFNSDLEVASTRYLKKLKRII